MSKLNLLTLLTLLALLGACGKRRTFVESVKEVPGPTEIVEKEVPIARDFEGAYILQDNGFIELMENADGDITILRTNQELITVNPKNGTYATIPDISGEKFEVVNGKVIISRDVNYKDGSRYDVEEDVSGSNVTGRRKTVYTFSKDGETLVLRVQIYANKSSHNINFIVADRELRSE